MYRPSLFQVSHCFIKSVIEVLGYSRRRVVVLEEVEFGASSVRHLEADSLASRALGGADDIGVAGGDSEVTVVLTNSRSVVVGGLLVGRRGHGSELNLSVSAEAV